MDSGSSTTSEVVADASEHLVAAEKRHVYEGQGVHRLVSFR